MFKQHNVITAVELGTSKICVLIGEYTDDELTIIGRGESAVDNAIVKGEILDMDLVQEKLIDAMDQADMQSGRELNNSAMFAIAVTGCEMDSFISEGVAFVQNEDGLVGEEEIYEAVRNAKPIQLGVNRQIINSFDAYFKLDGNRRVAQPQNHKARNVHAFSHIIHGDSTRLENFVSALVYSGLDCAPELIFSPIADIFGVLSDDELSGGALLIDFGAGTTEYAVVHQNGVLASGVLGIGFDHVASDLSVGLNLPAGFCRKILQDGTLERCVRDNLLTLECRGNSGTVRQIPVESFVRIADARIRELFELINRRLSRESFWRNLASGCVLTGGGAEFFKTREIFRQVCDLPSRIGKPLSDSDVGGSRYSTVYGALRYAYKLSLQNDSRRRDSFADRVSDKIAGLGDAFSRMTKSWRRNMKN